MTIRPLVFTLGNTENYERFKEQERPQKCGKRLFSQGGSVWKDYQEAREVGRLVGFSVYAVLADWQQDTLPIEGKLWRELRWDSDLFKLEELTLDEKEYYLGRTVCKMFENMGKEIVWGKFKCRCQKYTGPMLRGVTCDRCNAIVRIKDYPKTPGMYEEWEIVNLFKVGC